MLWGRGLNSCGLGLWPTLGVALLGAGLWAAGLDFWGTEEAMLVFTGVHPTLLCPVAVPLTMTSKEGRSSLAGSLSAPSASQAGQTDHPTRFAE